MSKDDKKYTEAEIKEARNSLWRKGNLEWKLDNTQKEILDNIKQNTGKVFVINCGRRTGKSFFLTIYAIETCLKNPKSIVKFLQPEQKMIRINIRPIMDEILADCPPELRPEFKTQDNIYRFPNKSEIQLAGTDSGNAEKIRGGNAHVCIIDEAAFVKSELSYIVRSILIPTTMLTRGKIILSSTSPKEEDHEFTKYMEQASINGRLIKKDIFQALKENEKLANRRITEEIIAEMIAEYPGGINDPEFKRECMNIIPKNGDTSVIPEFDDNVEKEVCVDNWPRPAFYDAYVGMDIGFKDLTVVLFGYYDFVNGVTVIEDEIVINGHKMTTDKLAEDIRKKESELFTDKLTGEQKTPHLRISDNNLIVINDLQRLHGLTFLPTAKDNKDMQVNKLRMEVSAYKIIINKRCKTLISHLRNANWNKNRTEFTRNNADKSHYDALDALLYMVRNIDKNRNPYPRGYRANGQGDSSNTFFNPNSQLHNKNTETILKMLGRKSIKKG